MMPRMSAPKPGIVYLCIKNRATCQRSPRAISICNMTIHQILEPLRAAIIVTTPYGSSRGLLRMAPEGSVRARVRCNLNGRLVGSVRLIDWYTQRLVRSYFYSRERFTAKRPNTIEFSVYTLTERVEDIC